MNVRYPNALLSKPGSTARLVDAFAIMGGTPMDMRTGYTTSEPPPATEFTTPAVNPPRRSKRGANHICLV